MFNRTYYKVLRRVQGKLYSAVVPRANGGVRYSEHGITFAPSPTQLLIFEKRKQAELFMAEGASNRKGARFELWSVKVEGLPSLVRALVPRIKWSRTLFERHWSREDRQWASVSEGTRSTPSLRLHQLRATSK